MVLPTLVVMETSLPRAPVTSASASVMVAEAPSGRSVIDRPVTWSRFIATTAS